jgi:hypothetical protein
VGAVAASSGSSAAVAALSYLSPQDQQTLEPLLPSAVAITNVGSEPIFAVALVWSVTGADGTVRKHTTTKVLSLVPGGVGILVGKSILALPICTITMPGLRECQSQLQGWSNVVQEISSARIISVAVDAILTRSGKIIGPDTTYLYQHLTALLSADKSLAQNILTMHAQGLLQDAIAAYLNQFTAPSVSDKSSIAYWNANCSASAAQVFQALLAQGDNEVFSAAQSILAQQRISLQASLN